MGQHSPGPWEHPNLTQAEITHHMQAIVANIDAIWPHGSPVPIARAREVLCLSIATRAAIAKAKGEPPPETT